MPALTGYGPPDKSAQTAGDYLSSSSKPSYGIGSSSTNYPTPAPVSSTAQPASSGGGVNHGQRVMKSETNPDGSVGNYTAQQWKMMDAIANGQLRKDEKGNWYNPQAATGFDAFMEAVLPILSMALAGGGLAGIGSGAAASAAGGAADGLSYIATTGLPEYASLGTEMAASTAAAGEVAATGLEAGTLGAGTLADISVTASSLGEVGAGLTAGEIGAGLGAGIGGAIDLTGASGSTMPKPNYPFSTYMPKGMIRSYLMEHGVPTGVANIAGGAGQGALISGLTGGNPLMGAVGGGVGTGVSDVISQSGLSNAVSSAVGGGVPGDMLSGAATSALGGGITAGAMGGNPLLAAESGAIGGAVGAGLKDAGLSSGFASTIGSQLGKVATMPSSPTGTSNISSGLDGLGSSMMNGLSNLPVADLAGLYAGGKANKQNQGLIDQLSNAANPFISAGQTALKDYQNLAPLEQQQLNASVTGGTTQVQGAQPLIGLGEQQLNIAGSGNLPPAQEAQLQQQIQAAKAQLAQQYSPDSTTYQELSAQIDQNAMLTRQQMLAGYQTSGQTTYGLGETQQTAGQTEIAKAYSDAQTEIDQNLKNALAMATTGLGPLSDAVMLGLKNNTQMQSTMSDLFKSIAGASAGSSGASSTVGGMLKNLVSGGSNTASDTNLNNLLGQYGAPQGSFVDPSTFMSGYQDNTSTYVGNTTSDTNFDNLMSNYTPSSDTGS